MTQQRRGAARPGPARRPRPTGAAAPVRSTSDQGRSASSARSSSRAGSRLGSGIAPRAAAARGADLTRSASRPASARRAAATGAAKRTRAPQPNRLTGRATVLVLVLGALLLAYAYPVRLYLNQQAQISSAEAAQAAQRRHIAQLTEEAAKWNDDEYKKAQIKKRLQMVPPGSVAYTLVGPASAAPAGDPDTGRAKDTGPWYGQLWSSVQAADKPRVAP